MIPLTHTVAVRASRLILLTVASGLMLSACNKPAPPPPPPPQVDVAQVIERRVQEWDEYTGRIQAVENVDVRPRVSGYIDQVAFSEGKQVKEGDLLFLLDPRPYKAEYDKVNAELVRSKTALELAGVELQRVQKLKASGAVSAEELDERLSALHQAEANVASAKAALDAVTLNLSFTRVTSPITGRVGRAEVTRGNLVTGGMNGGTLLTSVVSTDPVYVYFEADENAYLHYGQLARSGERPSSRDVKNPVELGLADEAGYPHRGYMDFVDNQLNPQTGTMRGRAVFDNKEDLFTPGLFARIRLLGTGEYPAILIEDRAIGTDQNQKFVLVVAPNNKSEYRPVKLGRLIDGLRVVRQGLKAGEIVVVNGLQRVRPGTEVKPTRITMGAPDAPAAPTPPTS